MEFSEFITVAQVDGVMLHSSSMSQRVQGLLCVTGHHLILAHRGENQEEFWVGLFTFTF